MPGMAATLDLQFRTVGFQDPIDGCRTDLRELASHRIVDVQLRLRPQHRHVGAQKRHKALAALIVEKIPDTMQRLVHRLSVDPLIDALGPLRGLPTTIFTNW